MAQILVRNLDEDTKARLKRRASRRGHSMEEEVRQILRAAANEPEGDEARLGSAIAARFGGRGLVTELPELRGQPARPARLRR
jgi:plasmid stability protein